MPMSFDEILSLAARSGPIEYEVKAWGGRKVFIRDPSSADVDQWRVYCHANQGKGVPFSARLCQLLLCDEDGNRIVPQTDEALQALADSDAAAIAEIAEHCLPMVNAMTQEESEELQKN